MGIVIIGIVLIDAFQPAPDVVAVVLGFQETVVRQLAQLLVLQLPHLVVIVLAEQPGCGAIVIDRLIDLQDPVGMIVRHICLDADIVDANGNRIAVRLITAEYLPREGYKKGIQGVWRGRRCRNVALLASHSCTAVGYLTVPGLGPCVRTARPRWIFSSAIQ